MSDYHEGDGGFCGFSGDDMGPEGASPPRKNSEELNTWLRRDQNRSYFVHMRRLEIEEELHVEFEKRFRSALEQVICATSFKLEVSGSEEHGVVVEVKLANDSRTLIVRRYSNGKAARYLSLPCTQVDAALFPFAKEVSEVLLPLMESLLKRSEEKFQELKSWNEECKTLLGWMPHR